MTEKLFYKDAYLSEFMAQVLDCRAVNRGYAVVLDRTAFFPEGGGQPGDTGVLGEANVLDTHDKSGEILHYTDAPLAVGTTIKGKIDWERRFDLMQQHSGEHIVSGLVHERYGYENVGFHMGADVITIDFSGVLSLSQLHEVELLANQKLWENNRVQIACYHGEELDHLVYRSKKALEGEVRIVRFPGADTCACCGTHVKRTGEIGCIRLLNVQHLREGVRVEMVSGLRCLSYFRAIADENHRVSIALSAQERETSTAVNRLKEENQQLKNRVAELETQRFEALSREYSGAGSALIFEPGLSPDSVRRLCVAVMEGRCGKCAVFSGDDGNGYKYAVGETGGDLREFIKKMNAELKGRGGGKPFFAQGSVMAHEKEIRKFFSVSK
ncbi:MAG: alanine--tRNA ligase-related protein [Oscillospiraceae bacterium]